MTRPLLDAEALVDAIADAVIARIIGDGATAIAAKVVEQLQAAERQEYIDVPELAARWNCTVQAAEKRLQRDPDLSQLALRIGRRRLWRVRDVERVLEERRAERTK